ncbi:MAG: type IV pilus biogenesis/stability protein PilW [Steroidobacteraceae bacterium]
MKRLRFPLVAIAALLLATGTTLAAGKSMSREERAQAALVNTQLGMTYMRQDNLAAARDKIEKALQQNPNTADTQMAAGFLYDRLGDSRKAVSHYERAARLGKDNPDVLNNVAVYLCRKGDKKRGVDYFLQAAESALYRTPEVAYANAGRCARADGRDEEAEQYYRRALAARPDLPDALLQLADLQHLAGNNLSARAFVQRYNAAVTPSAESLWLGYRVERALGDASLAQDYARRLKKDFPGSDQERLLLEAEQADR